MRLPTAIRSFFQPPAPQRTMTERRYRVLYARGDELLTPQQYRSSFERTLERVLVGHTNVNDEAIARAFGVSATAYACSEYRATTLANVPLKVCDPTGKTFEATTPLHYFAYSQAASILYNTELSLCAWGRTYLRKRYNEDGWPTGLQFLYPTDVDEILDGQMNVVGYRVSKFGAHEQVDPRHIIYIQAFDPDSQGLGLSKFEVAWRAMHVELGASTYAAAFFVNNAQIDGMLTFDLPLNEDEYKEAKEEWKQFKGAARAHKTAVMPAGAKFTPVQAVPKDIMMAELRGGEREDIGAIFGVDLVLIGLKGVADPLSANSTYSKTEVAHIRNVSLPRLRMTILAELNRQWAYRDFDRRDYYTLMPNEAGIPALAEANLLRSQTAEQLTSGNLLDFDEGRQLVGYGPREGYLLRKPDDALALWDAGGVTQNELRILVGLQEKGLLGEVVKIEGKLYPAARLLELALKNFEAISVASPSPFPLLNGSPLTPLPSGKVTVPEEPARPVIRNQMALELAVSFENNQFVRYARRTLSEWLTSQGISAEWIRDEDWRIVLARADVWTPADAATLIRRLQYDDSKKLDLPTRGYVLNSNGIYLALDGLETLSKSAVLDLQSLKLDSAESPVGILLAVPEGEVDLSAAPEAKYPLVANNVGLYLGGRLHHQWTLRHVSPVRARELKNWRHIVDRKGADHPFNCEALADSPVAGYVRWALKDGMDSGSVFDSAEKMLADELPTLAFEDGEPTLSTDSVRLLDLWELRSRDNYRRSLRAVARGLWNGALSRGAAMLSLDSTIQRGFRRAWVEGIALEGLKIDDLSDSEIRMRDALISDEQRHTDSFVDGVLASPKSQNGLLTPHLERVEQWVARYDMVMSKAMLVASRDKKKKWVYDPAKEHCHDCGKLNGRVYKASTWLRWGILPQSSALECFGTHCGCGFEDTDEPITPGRPPALRGPKRK